MKNLTNLIFAFISICFSLISTAQAQTYNGSFEARLTHESLNCAKDSVVVLLEVRGSATTGSFVMGNANFFLSYQNSELADPIYRSRGVYNGGGDYKQMTMTKTPGATSSVVSLNIENIGIGGAGQPVDNQWRKVASIAFRVVSATNPTKCYGVTLNASNPTTVVTLAYPDPSDPSGGASLTAPVTQGSLTSLSNVCPSAPIVTIAGTTTINSGQSATLTIASQNNVLPATVNLSDNTSVMLDVQNPSKTMQVMPTQTTDYTITSVTGSCGAGSAAAGQSTAKITVLTGSPCPPQKCIPATFTVLR